MTKTIGEHWVAAQLARLGWAPALTRDGLARTDLLAVQTVGERLQIEIQVKTATGVLAKTKWPLGDKAQQAAEHDREWFVLVAVPPDVEQAPRGFVVPRDHVAAAAWIEHKAWLHAPGVPAGQRNASVSQSRVPITSFERYESRWDLLLKPTTQVEVLLPVQMHAHALDPEIGLPPHHPWKSHLPEW